MKPTIALLQGDATGIGPELLAKLLDFAEVRDAAKILIISDRRVFENGCRIAGVDLETRLISAVDEADFSDGRPNLLDLPIAGFEALRPGEVSKAAGEGVLAGYGLALDLCAEGRADGLCFLPFNKGALHRAGLGVEDETQWAKARIGHRGRVSEFNVIDGMWNARVTSHIPLKEVAYQLTTAEIVAAIKLADETLRAAGFDRPRIAVAALNPHAGEGGSIGREEIEIITGTGTTTARSACTTTRVRSRSSCSAFTWAYRCWSACRFPSPRRPTAPPSTSSVRTRPRSNRPVGPS